jgi:hypothetical protein
LHKYNSFLSCEKNGGCTYIPDDDGVIVLAAEGSEVLFVTGERETLDQDLVQFEALHDLKSIEVPDDDVGLQLQKVVRVSGCDLNLSASFGLS